MVSTVVIPGREEEENELGSLRRLRHAYIPCYKTDYRCSRVWENHYSEVKDGSLPRWINSKRTEIKKAHYIFISRSDQQVQTFLSNLIRSQHLEKSLSLFRMKAPGGLFLASLTLLSLDKQKSLHSSCSTRRVNGLSKYTTNSSVVILSIMCTIDNKCVCVVSASPGWLTDPDGASISVDSGLHNYNQNVSLYSYCMCGGVKSTVGLWHRFLQNKKRRARIWSRSELRGERVTQQIPDIFSVRRCRVYHRLSRCISKNSAGTRSGGNQRRRLIDDTYTDCLLNHLRDSLSSCN